MQQFSISFSVVLLSQHVLQDIGRREKLNQFGKTWIFLNVWTLLTSQVWEEYFTAHLPITQMSRSGYWNKLTLRIIIWEEFSSCLKKAHLLSYKLFYLGSLDSGWFQKMNWVMSKSSEALTPQYSIDLKLYYWQIKVFAQNSHSALVAFLKQQLVPNETFLLWKPRPWYVASSTWAGGNTDRGFC